MQRTDPRSLDAAALSRRLAALAGDEREVQVEFLLHLDAIDGRRGWAEAGYPSLWEWCLRVLHLREASAAQAPRGRAPIPAAVRREVWKRGGGRCAWQAPDGRRCGSTWELELDHVVPAALGGPSTADSLRIHCRSHNQLRAEEIFGPAHMDLFRRGGPGRTRSLLLGDAHDP